jgi:hypothetical protein
MTNSNAAAVQGNEAVQFADTLRKLTVDVTGHETVGGLHRFAISNETDARHAGKVFRACRLPRVKVLAPAAAGSSWVVTMGASK